MNTLTLPITILISIPESILIAVLGLKLLGIKTTMKQVLLIGLFQALCSYLIHLAPVDFGFITLLQACSFAIIVYLVLHTPFKIALVAILSGLTIYASIEAAMAPLLINLAGLSLQTVLENMWLRYVYFLPQALILVAIIALISHFKIRLPEALLDKLGPKHDTVNRYFPIISLFLFQNLLVSFFYLDNFAEKNNQYDLPISFVVLSIVLPLVLIKMIKRLVSFMETEIETQAQVFTLSQIEELLKTIRCQRHNFNHDLQVMYGLLEVEAFQEAKEYIQSAMTDIAATSELVKTDNLGITALLRAKMGVAEGKNVKLDISINTSLKELAVSTRDANIILGNLIDNAFEAVAAVSENRRQIKVLVDQDVVGYRFEVTNFGTPIAPEVLSRIFEPGFSTKGAGRGMGLHGVKNLVEKYGGAIKVTSDTNVTSFKLSIPHR